MKLTDTEKHALIDAAAVFSTFGVEIDMPWEGNLDYADRVLYEALLGACRAYHDRMTHPDDPCR